MAERYQLPRSCVPPTMRRKDGGFPPSGGLEGGKTRRIREEEDNSPYVRPQTSRAESSPTHSKAPPCGAGAGSRVSCKPAQSRRSQSAARGAHNRPAVTSDPHFCPDQRVEGAGSHAGGMQSRQADALLRLPTRRHGGPGPRVTQPARQMLHASNRTATCATTAPLRLRNQYRDSRRPSARPNSASLARRSIRPKVGRQ
jgi:hypothetical protein